jgi:ubiquinone/menaquinone biosynthesis C-methylase UbiE
MTSKVNDSWNAEPHQLVAEGYDQIADEFVAWAQGVRAEERARYTRTLLRRVRAGARILELACGAGVPTTRQLAERLEVTGADIAAQQLVRARRHVPSANFVHVDMTLLRFPPESFDAVAAFYSLIHVDRQEQPGLLTKIVSWLRPGGLLVAPMGARATEAGYEEFFGVPMYWSSFDTPTNKRLIEEAGLCILSAREETAEEFGEPVTFLWMVAEKPRGPFERHRAAGE